MNNKSILDLTLRLSQALDQNYDVISMDTVLSVISALEGTTITKEQLEATRLAKYINQLRRRTNCEKLARRAKSLLKRWREMVGIQQQHSNESSVSIGTSSISVRPVTSTITSSTATASFNMPVTDNAVSTSQLVNPQLGYQHFLDYRFQSSVKLKQPQPYSQPTSPINLQEKSNPNEFVISVSNPAPATNLSKSSNVNIRKKKRLEKTTEDDPQTIHQQQKPQPTSFANLLTELGGYNTSLPTFSSTRKTIRDKRDNIATTVKPVETYVIEHSSNSNSDIICLPSNPTLGSDITSATNVPPIVIDLQDTNSSMAFLVSKDVTNASFSGTKQTSKKSKKERKHKERDSMSRQSQHLQEYDDNNASTASYQHKRPSEMHLVDEKSHSACPTISNISGT